MKLSSILIAKNEEQNIEKCIINMLNCIDEINVFIDDLSDDKSFEIADKFNNVKLRKIKWQGFSETKQEALKFVTNDWVFWIDADEVITEKLSEELISFKNNLPQHSVYSVPRKAFFLGKWIKHCGWYPDRVNRLFNKNEAKFSQSSVHEFLHYKGQTGKLKNDLLHFTDPDIFHYFEKFNSYTSLAADDLKKKNRVFKISDILLRPAFAFFKMYILKKGFLDGIQGFILCVFSSTYVFTKYCKLWELNRKES